VQLWLLLGLLMGMGSQRVGAACWLLLPERRAWHLVHGIHEPVEELKLVRVGVQPSSGNSGSVAEAHCCCQLSDGLLRCRVKVRLQAELLEAHGPSHTLHWRQAWRKHGWAILLQLWGLWWCSKCSLQSLFDGWQGPSC
jgi:hypothetical protein